MGGMFVDIPIESFVEVSNMLLEFYKENDFCGYSYVDDNEFTIVCDDLVLKIAADE